MGVILSLLFYIYKTMKPHFAEVSMDSDGTFRDAEKFGMETSQDMAIFRYDGDLYFANASYLEKQLLNAVADKPQLKVLVLDLEAVDQIDVTGEEMLTHMSERLEEAGIDFMITRAKFKVTDALKRSGLYDRIGEEQFFGKRVFAMDAIKEKYGDSVDMSHLEEHQPKADVDENDEPV